MIEPLLHLRGDRPGRTASFAEYLEDFTEYGLYEQVRLLDEPGDLICRRHSILAIVHNERTESLAAVLAGLADGWPVVFIGTAVRDWLQALYAETEARRRIVPFARVDELPVRIGPAHL